MSGAASGPVSPTSSPGVFPAFPADSDHPGWLAFRSTGGRFSDIFGTVRMQVETPARVRCRMTPEPGHRNIRDGVHGGFAMAFVDQVLFIGPHALGIDGALGGATIDVTVQFFGTLAIAPIDAIVEVLRVTGRLIFVRGTIEQDGTAAIGFTGTVRKATRRA